MHAFLITGLTKEARLKEAKSLLSKLGLKEILYLEPENSKDLTAKRQGSAKRVLIAKIRSLIGNLQISPLDREKGRGVILEEANLLTADAANAFLKTIEEPPPGNYLVLTAPTRESVLETIASRTAQIDLGAPSIDLSEKDLKKAEVHFKNLTENGVGERFKFVDSVKDRDTSLSFVVGQIYIVREKMLETPNLEYANLLEALQETKTYLEANVNVKLALSELVLKYPGKN